VSLGDRFGHTQAVPAVLHTMSSPEGVRDAARRFVASRATGVDDCRELLAMLGLAPSAREVAAFQTTATDDTVIQAEETRT
jgi:hypothetical protein